MKTLLLVATLALISSCTQSVETVDTTPEPSYCSTEVAEISECTTSTPYPGGITVTGNAGFYRRTVELNNPPGSGLTLGAKASGTLPIKYAEIRILSGSTVVQCGKTDATGALKAVNGTSDLQVPAGVATYTIQVLSRTNHSMPVPGGKPAFSAYASVKKEICANELHRVSANFSSGAPNVNLTADSDEVADPEIAGGAFNIYNDIVTSYEFLANNTGVSDLSCLSPKLEVFWKAGFNPSQYIYPSLDPNDLDGLSFYLRGYNQLFINGGKLGNVSSEDTDHFDDAVIIHELGHRIEDVCGRMDSPGGTHYGLFRTDPRLAWSEGWGNFFGAHIIKNNLAAINPDVAPALGADGWVYYLDTTGYNDGLNLNGSNLIQLDLTRPGNNPEVFSSSQDLHYDKVDPVAHPGEGHFREVSISRSLFKSTNVCTNPSCTDQNYFAQMWQAFTSMASSSYPFRSSVRFYNRLNAIGSLPLVDNILNNDEAQQRDGNAVYTSAGAKTWVPYGVKLAISATPCQLKLQPREEYYNVTFELSDQRYSNHFYHIDRLTLPTVTSITMTAVKDAGTNLDIDLILYQDGYSFPTETCLAENSQGDCTTYTKKTTSPEFVRSDRSTGLVKTIGTINALTSNTAYLLNVKAFTAGKTITDATQYSYSLATQNGEYLCPSAF